MQTPTLISWSLRVEQQLSPNTALTVGYVGSHGYHELIGVDANEPVPTICPAAPCPAVYPTWIRASRRLPPIRRTLDFRSARLSRERPFPREAFSFPRSARERIRRSRIPGRGFRWDQLLQRAASGCEPPLQPAAFRCEAFTHFRKTLDDGDSLNQTTAGNAPGLVSNPFNLAADRGLATFDVRNVAVINAIYELPFGRGQALRKRLRRFRQRAGERMVGGQHRHRAIGISVYAATQLQPVEQRRHSQSGAAVSESRFTGSAVLGNPNQWFNPAAFIAPPRPAVSTATSEETRSSVRAWPPGISRC